MKQLIQVGVLGAALAFTLVGSYLVYFDDSEGPSADPDGTPVYVASADQLQKLTWTGEDKDIVIERKTEGDGYLEVTVTTRKEVVPEIPVAMMSPDDTDGDTDSGMDTDAAPEPPPTPEPELVEEVTRFIGNKQAEALWEDFAPFRADRELTAEGDAEFGFDEPYAKLTVERTTGPVEVVFGAPTYGDRARYLTSGDKTFLVKKRTISRIEATDKLMERSLHPLETADVKKVSVTRDGTTRSFSHQNPDDRAKAYWADAATPDTRDAMGSGWVPDLLGLRARSYVDALPEGATPVFQASLEGDGGPHAIELFVKDADGSDGEETRWFARTTHNRGVVELTASQAEAISADLDGVMDATSPDEAPGE